MKNLVIAVSLDSSLELLGEYADIIVLDKGALPTLTKAYETVYIRSHFSHPGMTPQVFRTEIEALVQQVKAVNPSVTFIDGMDTVDKVVAFEDKWGPYQTFGAFMPKTQLYSDAAVESFIRPIYKKRLSSRGSGVTWDKGRITKPFEDWIVQESVTIKEELRVYSIFGKVYPVAAVRTHMTEGNKAQAVASRELTPDEMAFSSQLLADTTIDIVGIDLVRAEDSTLYLLEANRSPGFAKFTELTGANLADILYE